MHRTLTIGRIGFALAIPLFTVLVVTASTASASTVTYSSLPIQQPDNHANDIAAGQVVESQFLAALSSYGTETYDEFLLTEQGFTASQNLTFGSSGVTAVAQYAGVFGPAEFLPAGYTYSGNALLEEPGAGNNSMSFSAPVTAFGTYIDQAGDADADTLSLELQNTVTMTDEIVPIGTLGPDAGSFNIFYFGVTDTNAFNEVTLLLTNPADGVLLDNTTVGPAVPEPSTMALVLCAALVGLAAICVGRRRAAASA